MLSSISPLGERARSSRWWLTTTAYVMGSIAGGLAIGALSGGLGSLLPDPWLVSPWALGAAALLLLTGLALDLRVFGLHLPSWKRQVDEQWLARYRGWVYGVGFGAQLGFGVVTIITSSTTYAVVLLAVLSGHPAAGMLIGGVFGMVRALPSVFMRRAVDRQYLHKIFERVERWAHPAEAMARVAMAAGAVALAAAAVGS